MAGDKYLRATVRRILKASAEEVFAYWTEAKKLKVWLGLTNVEVDARVGGRFQFQLEERDLDPGVHRMWGEYRILETSRIVSSWIYEPPCGEVRKAELTVEIKDLTPGLVQLTVSDEDPCHLNRHERTFSRLQWSLATGSLEQVMDLDRQFGEGQWYRHLPQSGCPVRRTTPYGLIYFELHEIN